MSSRLQSDIIRMMRKYCYVCILLCGLLSAGCAGSGQLPLHQQLAPLPPEPVCRVAVLPFQNDSDFQFAGTLVSKVFSTQLQASGDYLIVQEGDIHKVYQQMHLLPGRVPTLEQLQIIANRVNAQALITGIVMEVRENRGEHGTVNPLIVEEVQLRDGYSGETLWTAFHRRQGTDYKKTMHFGTIHTVTGLSRQMTEEIINLWFKKGLTQCNVSPRS